jgi:F-type H+-transporting ATPase subunit b
MPRLFLAQPAGLLTINGTLLIEIVAFLAMLYVLARWVYPYIERAAEARQRQIAEQLEAAERSRADAEERLKEAKAQLDQARSQASEIISGAGKSGEQLRADLRRKAEEDAKRIIENASKDIETERQKAIDSVRGEVAELVIVATEKVIGEAVDAPGHRRLIEQAIQQVGTPGDDGAQRRG